VAVFTSAIGSAETKTETGFSDMMWIRRNGCKNKGVPGFIFVSSIIFDRYIDGNGGKTGPRKLGSE
jgi:hypothetical protein